MKRDSFGLYLHIPFCFNKCPYCDFNSYAVSLVPEKEYVSALIAELDFRAYESNWRGKTVKSIYFGGGTPSVFKAKSIDRIISFICSSFAVAEDVEISLEANPGTLTADLLAQFKVAGVNRISIGAQSFNSQTLKTLGRIHSASHTEAAVEAARSAGFRNLSLDLIYGVPGQSVSDFKVDLRRIIELEPEHVSPYGLTIEKGTPFFQSYKSGRLILPPEDDVVQMMEELNSSLSGAGFERYEISNYARPGREAIHNLNYWDAQDYLGVGAGAHSFNSNCEISRRKGTKKVCRRWVNYHLPNRYMKEAIARGKAEASSETLNKQDLIFEFFFLGLRKVEGVSLKDFKERFDQEVKEVYPVLLDVLLDRGLIALTDENLALSERGLLFADSVIENFADPELSARLPREELSDKIVTFPVKEEKKEGQSLKIANS
jgi:oxygen-independent coproporphyrinogen-3 oxidase